MEGTWGRVRTEFACAHATSVLTYKTCSNGVRQYRRRCVRCGPRVPRPAPPRLPEEEENEYVIC